MPGIFDELKPMSPGQEKLKRALQSKEYEIVGVFGPTGTGKSLFSLLYGIDAVLEGEYKRFIISRPVVDVVTGREYTVADLGAQYYEMASAYLRDILSGFMEWGRVEEALRDGRIVLADTHYLRGRTFDESLIFLDDAQSVSPESAVEVMMRIGRDSRLIVAGDPVFQRTGESDGATMVREVLLGEERAAVIDLGIKDIVRPGARRGIRLLLETRMRSREMSEVEKSIVDAARIHAPDADVITAVEFVEEKKRFGVTSEHTPDALIVVKEGSLGRLVGRGGERIEKIEADTELRLRAVELTLDFSQFVRAIHPVGWVYKHIADADFAGPDLAFRVYTEGFGAFVGQKGFYVKFLDTVFRKLMGVGVRAIEVARPQPRRRKGRR